MRDTPQVVPNGAGVLMGQAACRAITMSPTPATPMHGHELARRRRPARVRYQPVRTSTRSTTNTRVSLGAITPPAPRAP